MLIELYIFACVIIAYGTFTTLGIIGFNKLNQNIPHTTDLNFNFISIVISARNEQDNIREFISEIVKQNFPKDKFELILIDDCSEDDTYNIANNLLQQSGLTYQLIRQTTHCGKKKNIAEAISLSKGEIIITTDADVTFRHSNWLTSIFNYFNSFSPNLLIMPVDFYNQNGLLQAFQITENIALTAITAGYTALQKPFMCNGANLAFKKSAYLSVSGYNSHLTLSSGEDVFLLEDIKKLDPKSIHYLLSRELIVKTKAATNLKQFMQQRIRWASKTKNNSNLLNGFAGFITLMANLIFFALFVAILKKSVIIPYLSIFALAKVVFDFLLLFLASNFLGRIKYIWWIIPFECVYWIYALFVGVASVFFKPTWKGKKIN